ncbi:MAG TPA: ABC transporter substrate-binding protein [Trueperaceae bacterium]|nr:ABC transporter substrate-binding protein [Trueperaceae bacterium]
MKSPSRRILILLSLLLAFGAVFAQETPTAGGTAIVVLGSDPEHLNPGISTSYPVGAVAANLYSGLVRQRADGVPEGDLAESWTVSDDNLVYTFTLRAANFHDGTPVTSADVVFSMNEVLAPNHGRFITAYNQIASIEAPDAGTVVITLKQPYAPLVGLLTVFDAPVLPKHLYEGTDPLTNPVNNQPVGSGPFKFSTWVRGERLEIVRNDDYFLESALLDRIIFRVVPQDVARSTALEVGEADLAWGFYLPPADLPRLEANPDLQVWRGITIPALYFVFINNTTPGLDDPLVRQALMHAVDRDQVVEQAQGGLGQAASGPFGAGFAYAYSENTDYRTLYPYDPDRARELLAEAGVSGLELRFVYDSARGAFAAAGEIMRDQLGQVGITLRLEPVERAVMVERVYNGDYDLSMQSFTSSGDPVIGYHRIYLTAAQGTPFVNATGYGSPEVDALLAQAASLADLDARAAVYDQALEILAAAVPTMVMFDELATEAAAANLRGMRTLLDQRDGLEFLWFAQ